MTLPTPSGVEQRSRDPLALLSRELNTACVGAVQSLELAAILEAEGLTDSLVQQRYGETSVFSCAERLFQMVPYRSPAPATTERWVGAPPWRGLTRGVIYLLPAAWTPALLSLGSPADVYHGAGLGLLVASLFGWGWMQGLAYIGFTGLAVSRVVAADRLKKTGTWAVTAAGVLAFTLARVTGQDAPLVALSTVVVSAYLAAATVLLVQAREATLMLSAVPALVWMGLTTLGAVQVAPDTRAAVTLLLAVGWPVVSAALSTHVTLRDDRVLRVPWLEASRHCLYGWLCALSMSLVFLVPAGHSPGSSGTVALMGWSWTLAPLILTLGLMERAISRAQRGMKQQAQRRGAVRQIVQSAAGQVGRSLAGYLVMLAGVYLIALRLAQLLGAASVPAALLAGHLLMGASLLWSGLLNNFGLLRQVLLIWAVAGAVQVLGRVMGMEPVNAYALGASVATLGLTVAMVAALSDVRHLA